MRNYNLLIFIFLIFHSIYGQSVREQTLFLTENIQQLKVDILDQVYTLTEDQYFNKWDKKGNLLFQYINNRDGKLSQIDVRNPLQILLFYADQQRIISLDRTLSPLKEWQINPEDWGFISSAAVGKNDQIWLFDQFNYQLGSIDRDRKSERQKTDLIFCCLQPPVINFMALNENYLFLFDQKQGIIQCDLLGQFIKFIPINEWQKVLTFGNTIWIIKNLKVIEITNNGQIEELTSTKNTNDIIGFNNKEIFMNDGKSKKVILISKE